MATIIIKKQDKIKFLTNVGPSVRNEENGGKVGMIIGWQWLIGGDWPVVLSTIVRVDGFLGDKTK